jgi:lysophospholipase L1-like esterase
MKLLLPLLSIVILGASLARATPTTDPVDPANYSAPIKVACVGDSITEGFTDSKGKDYPSQLQELLGPKWQVSNFGMGGRTLLRKGDHPWWKEQAYPKSHDLYPDVVIIMLGTNDTKVYNWKYKDDFVEDYKDLIESYKRLSSHPHIWIMRPPPVPKNGGYDITETILDEELPMIDRIADDENVGLIDIYGALKDHPELEPDNVHPNDEGAHVIAQTVAKAIVKQNP